MPIQFGSIGSFGSTSCKPVLPPAGLHGIVVDLLPHVELLHQPPLAQAPDHGALDAYGLLHTILQPPHDRPGSDRADSGLRLKIRPGVACSQTGQPG